MASDLVPTWDIPKQIYKGNSANFPLQFLRKDGVTPIPLAGATIAATLKVDRGANALVTWGIGTGITVSDAPNGLASLMMSPANTNQTIGNYSLDVTVTEGDGTVTSIAGPVRIVPH